MSQTLCVAILAKLPMVTVRLHHMVVSHCSGQFHRRSLLKALSHEML